MWFKQGYGYTYGQNGHQNIGGNGHAWGPPDYNASFNNSQFKKTEYI